MTYPTEPIIVTPDQEKRAHAMARDQRELDIARSLVVVSDELRELRAVAASAAESMAGYNSRLDSFLAALAALTDVGDSTQVPQLRERLAQAQIEVTALRAELAKPVAL